VGLALDDLNVYTAGPVPTGDDGAVYAISKKDLISTQLASGINPVHVTVHGGNVYWAQGSFSDAGAPSTGIAFASTSAGGLVRDQMLVGGQVSPFTIANDGVRVYWANYPTGGDLWQANLEGPPSPQSIAVDAFGVAVDETQVYWTQFRPEGFVMRAPKGAAPGSPVPVASGQASPYAIHTDSAFVYWTTFAAPPLGAVMKAPKDGGEPVEVVSRQDKPSAVTTDAVHLYWANAGPYGSLAGSVWRIPKAGGRSLLLAVGQEPPAIAVDDRHVYWTSAGSVWRVAK
jgi:hypothetical protein